MANYERGVYEPSDEVRVFDGSEEEDDVEGSRLPLLIVLALLVLAMFAGVVWLAYTQGVARGRGETPVLTAAAGPERVAPQQAGGANVPYQGFKIYEQPAPPDDSGDATPQPKPAAAAKSVAPVAKPGPVAAAPVPVPPPAVKQPAPAPKSVAALIQQADTKPQAAKPAPVAMTAKPVSPPAKAAMVSPAPTAANGAPRQLVTPATAPVAAAPVTTAKPATGGAFVLQIGAYKSQADADAAWKSYKAKHAALLSGYSDDIQQADLGEKGTWYRLRVSGFSDREVASALCDRLKADGGACILGK
jgi:cell division septation protein DedD